MREFSVENATVFTGAEVVSGATVRVAGGIIQELSTGPLPSPHSLDAGGRWLLPGLVDLQLYGGSDRFLNESPTAETIEHIYQTHLKAGTTSLVPTLYSTSHDVVRRAFDAVRTVRQRFPFGILGLHVEGPYLNPEKRGAHSAAYVRPPDERELAELAELAAHVPTMLTIAPELFSRQQLQTLLDHADLILSLGHSNATYGQATEAFNAGIPLATHLYNAMRPFESREPGVVGAIFDHPKVKASIIADGYHCDFAAVRIAKRLLGDRLFLISDATLANPPRQAYAFEDFIIEYDHGRYLNPEGKLAGSAITLLDAVRNCIRHAGIEPAEAFRMASTVPAEIIGQGNRLGKVAAGFVANLLLADERLESPDVIVNGDPGPATWSVQP